MQDPKLYIHVIKDPLFGQEYIALYFTHCGLVMSYGDIDLGQHWLR